MLLAGGTGREVFPNQGTPAPPLDWESLSKARAMVPRSSPRTGPRCQYPAPWPSTTAPLLSPSPPTGAFDNSPGSPQPPSRITFSRPGSPRPNPAPTRATTLHLPHQPGGNPRHSGARGHPHPLSMAPGPPRLHNRPCDTSFVGDHIPRHGGKFSPRPTSLQHGVLATLGLRVWFPSPVPPASCDLDRPLPRLGGDPAWDSIGRLWPQGSERLGSSGRRPGGLAQSLRSGGPETCAIPLYASPGPHLSQPLDH